MGAGVGQGCLLLPFLFLLAVDWVVGASVVQGQDGVWWRLWAQLGGLGFAGGLALLLHARWWMQGATGAIAEASACFSLNVCGGEGGILRAGTMGAALVMLGVGHWEMWRTFLALAVSLAGGVELMLMSRSRLAWRRRRSDGWGISGVPGI